MRAELRERGIAADGERRARRVRRRRPRRGDRAAACSIGPRRRRSAVADALDEILAAVSATSAGAHVVLDRRLARGLSYYTGAIMEIAVPDLAGSLGGGGRYDGLIGMFSGENIPACGFSLGLERILVVMGEREMFPASVEGGGGGRPGDAVRRRRPPARLCGWPPICGGRSARRGVSRARQAREAVQVRRGARDPIRDGRRRRRARQRRGDDQEHEERDSRQSVAATASCRHGWLPAQSESPGRRQPPLLNSDTMTIQPLGQLARTHTCGALHAPDVGKDVVLLGWVHRVRDLGSLVFLDIRDRHGITQVVARDDAGAGRGRQALRPEYVVAVLGQVELRVAGVGEPEGQDRRDRGRRSRDPAAERREDAAVSDRGRGGRSPKTRG